jgi:hypothetical protein
MEKFFFVDYTLVIFYTLYYNRIKINKNIQTNCINSNSFIISSTVSFKAYADA